MMFKRLGLLSLCLAFVLGCSSSKTYLRVPKNGLTEFLKPQAGKPTLISAHRGGGDYTGYPENCIESFAYLANKAAMIIECDIGLTKDSVLVMLHDDVLDRTTTGKGKLNAITYDYTQSLFLKDNAGTVTKFRMPTLEKVLRWGKGKVVYTLDVKRSVPFEKVVDMVHQTHTEDVSVIITYNAQDAAKVYKLDPNLMISVTIRNEAEYQRHHELGIPDNRMVAFVGTREPSTEHYQFLHQKGIPCILGTLGNLDKMAQAKGDQVYVNFAKNGADIMSTDRPLEMAEALKKK
ncbi:glycerophosphodiester phosphodiesterase [Siphonobacter sp. SORGH_AS_0500]|uniref:glycerophosphodiester phosphodiesterase family protein n=1 Tax=Siphonobacter sp. SORGH_AS_0500 TaxID=1864824 RepID=UPI000CAC3114|nr:glycerophosphodiester phosphodiesterase family protein [Siphonobacter sp. SORGH_AS_0500]PKK38063.1 glycerophosphodiester phosphodiesterase [Siphonobacter sp. SORGH_AS_0500]